MLPSYFRRCHVVFLRSTEGEATSGNSRHECDSAHAAAPGSLDTSRIEPACGNCEDGDKHEDAKAALTSKPELAEAESEDTAGQQFGSRGGGADGGDVEGRGGACIGGDAGTHGGEGEGGSRCFGDTDADDGGCTETSLGCEARIRRRSDGEEERDDQETGEELEERYGGELLVLAERLGRRLLPAFETATGDVGQVAWRRFGVRLPQELACSGRLDFSNDKVPSPDRCVEIRHSVRDSKPQKRRP